MHHRLVVFISMLWVVFTVNTAAAVTWTAEELVQIIQQAQADGQPVPRRVAEKIHAELASSGFQIVDGQLVRLKAGPDALTSLTTPDNSLEVLAVLDPTPGAQQRLQTLFNRPFPITLQLPPVQNLIHDPARQALMDLVLDYLYNKTGILGEFALEVIRNNWEEVLYYVLTDNSDGLAQLLSAEKLCPSLVALKAPMLSGPLYSNVTGACLAVDARTPGPGPHFATPSCTTEISFQMENFPAFCREALTTQPNPLLGNPKAWPTVNVEADPLSTLPDASSKWSLSSGAQLAIGVEPIAGNHIPFMKRFNFRQAGSCELEMRVYKKDIAATNLTPLLWIHGGAWKYRGTGFIGLETLISNYTEDNFIVFTPFYRLAGDKDGNAECRNAPWTDIVADAEAALDWVKANGASLGANTTTGKIPVTGQSAGGHLAGWLMTHRTPDVSRGLLVYPPTDVYDFLTRLQGVGGASFPPLSDAANTPYDPSSAEDILETFLQLPDGGARTVDLNNPPPYVTENSFAQKIRANPSAYPPAFIMHGTRDSLLTYTQSEVLCEAYGGVVNVNWSTADLRAIFPCGAESQLHLFKEAEHAFEVCPAPATSSVCRAGSPASAALLVDSLQQARQWLLNVETPPGPSAPGTPATINVPRTSFTGKFTVSWRPATGTVTHYELYESKDRTFATPGVLAYSGPNLSAALSKSNGNYYYRVRACNNDLCSDYKTGSNGVAVLRLRF